MKPSLTLLLVIAAACSASPQDEPQAAPQDAGHDAPLPSTCDREFVVSPAFPPEERAMLEAAVVRWNAIATERFCLRVGEADGVRHGITRIPYRGEQWQQLSKTLGGADVLGVHYGNDQIGIVDVLDEVSFPLVALHEFGHAHGLGHIEAPAIMYYGIGTAFDFTALDMAECRRVGACH